jgi:hypothetical protein
MMSGSPIEASGMLRVAAFAHRHEHLTAPQAVCTSTQKHCAPAPKNSAHQHPKKMRTSAENTAHQYKKTELP